MRRRFGWAPGSKGDSADLTGLEDEHIGGSRQDRDGHRDEDGHRDRGHEGTSVPQSRILTGEIERPRVGPMRDIAATIQPEQDHLVRGDLATSVCVQGAPGTGKTAVGLHRAAYLLYAHPQRIRRGGLLILGPNPTFLAYIAEVLPALGESARRGATGWNFRQSTLESEIAQHPVTAPDDERAAAVKHDARMAEVLRRALYGNIGTYADPLVVPDGSYRWRVSAEELNRIVDGVRAEEPPYGIGRERVRTRAVRRLREQAEWRAGPQTNAWARKVSGSRPVRAYVDAVWPRMRPEEVLARLLTDAEALADAAEGLLDADERKAILWAKPPRSYKSARWSAADLVLLDEVAGLVEHPEGYGHVVVDEAQDLSPMECRAIARRAPFGSLTVLGDLAQGTTPWAAREWGELLGHLGKPDAVVVPLTIGFRVPEAVVGLANRLLARLDVRVPPARSLRRDGELTVRAVPDARDVLPATVDAVRGALAHEGSIGVIAADPDIGRVREALRAAGVEAAGPEELGARVAVVPATLTKGLEYDHVVAVEPAAVAEAEARGLHRLYVVLTRPVSRLEVVHARPLPW